MRKLILLAVLAVVIAAGPQRAAASHTIQSVLTWNEMALDTVRTQSLGAFPAARLYAMVTVAMYDAVSGINVARGWSTRSEALVSPYGAPSDGNRRAAAMAAGHAVLSALYPSLAGLYDTELANGLATLSGTPDFIEAGRQWGESVGQQVVALRANDGSSPSETQPGSS